MKTKVQKWGNSLGVRIPKVFAKEAKIDYGNFVEIKLEDDKIIINSPKPSYDLDTLLEKVTDKNIHKEIDMGKSVGKEAW